MSAARRNRRLPKGKTSRKVSPKSTTRRKNTQSSVSRPLVAFCALFLVLGLGAVLYFGYGWFTTSSLFGLEEITVQGNQRLEKDQILAAAGVMPGDNCLGLRMSMVETGLAANPWVKTVSVRRELPDGLIINLEEHEPVFWIQKDQAMHYADINGRIIDEVRPGKFASLPVLELGEDSFEYTDALPGIMEVMENGRIPFSRKDLAWVRITDQGQIQMFSDRTGLTMTLDAENWKQQTARFQQVWDQLAKRDEAREVRSLTASSDGRIWVEKGA